MTDRGGWDRTADPLIVGADKPTDSTSDHSQPRFPSRSDWDVIVIGAGPAGSLVSRLLARRGHAVLLIDARGFPRDKVCGGCLSARAVAQLRQAGLGNVPADAGAVPLDAIEIRVGASTTRFPLNGGFSLSRRSFDQHLVDAALADGVEFVSHTVATVEKDCVDGRRRVTARRGVDVVQFSASCVVCADGLLRSSVRQFPELAAVTSARSHLGIGACVSNPGLAMEERVRPGTIVMAVGRDGYAGLARCEQGRLSIAAAISPVALKSVKRPEVILQRLLASAGLPFVDDPGSIDWQGTPLLTSHARRVATERLFVIGDAAGYVEPFTGEGMANGLESAWRVAPLVHQAICQWEPQLALSWHDCYVRSIRQRQWPVRTLGTLLRYPRFTRSLLQLSQLVPIVPHWFISRINDPRPSTVSTESFL